MLLKSSVASEFQSSEPPAVPTKSIRRHWGVALALLLLAVGLAIGSHFAVYQGRPREGILFSLLSLAVATVAAGSLIRTARRTRLLHSLGAYSFGITRQGWAYLLGVLLLGLAALNTGQNLLYLILAALLAAIITSGIASRLSLRGLDLSLQVPEYVFENELIPIKVSLQNGKGFLPSFSLLVEDARSEPSSPAQSARSGLELLSRGGRVGTGTRDRNAQPLEGGGSSKKVAAARSSSIAYFPSISAGEVRSEPTNRRFTQRGQYPLRGLRISTCFPFGLFRRGRNIPSNKDVIVFPRIRRGVSMSDLLQLLPGFAEGTRPGSGENLYSLRKYIEGECSRFMDWKATAKTGELMVRQYAHNDSNKLALILDTFLPVAESGIPEEWARRFEEAVSAAASLAVHFAAQGVKLELLSQQGHVSGTTGEDPLLQILRFLALVRCRAGSEKADLRTELEGALEGTMSPSDLLETFSSRVYKIVLTSKHRGSFPATTWPSAHVLYFEDL